MQYTRLGDTGLVVSRLTFGAMTFGVGDGDWGKVAKVEYDTAKRLVDKSIDGGINFFDTADAYTAGESETMLAKALGERRKDVIIATKVGFRYNGKLLDVGLSRRHIIKSAEDSLKRLNTDYIDVYIVHREEPFTPMEETLEALENLVKRGMVRYVGYSNWSAWKAAKAVGLQRQHGWAPFITAQMYYSLLGRDLEHEVVPFVQDAGIGTMIWSPLVGGFLSGKYTRDTVLEDNNRLSDPGNEFHQFDQEHGFQVLDALGDIAEKHSASVAQIAIAWLLAKEHVSTIVIGASKLHHLEDNLGAVDVKLSDEDVQCLDDLTAIKELYPTWFNRKTRETMLADALKK